MLPGLQEHDCTRGLPMSIIRVHTRTEGHASVPSALSLAEPRSLKLVTVPRIGTVMLVLVW